MFADVQMTSFCFTEGFMPLVASEMKASHLSVYCVPDHYLLSYHPNPTSRNASLKQGEQRVHGTAMAALSLPPLRPLHIMQNFTVMMTLSLPMGWLCTVHQKWRT
jgi:hypothetical protein